MHNFGRAYEYVDAIKNNEREAELREHVATPYREEGLRSTDHQASTTLHHHQVLQS